MASMLFKASLQLILWNGSAFGEATRVVQLENVKTCEAGDSDFTFPSSRAGMNARTVAHAK
jgi:hypothetical protein